jgi:hypothetical protein
MVVRAADYQMIAGHLYKIAAYNIFEKGAMLEGLSQKEYYNIIPKGYGEDNYFILSSYEKVNETQVERNELQESHVTSKTHANICGEISLFSHLSPFTHALSHSHNEPFFLIHQEIHTGIH